MDELSAPLDVLAPPAPLPRRLLRGMLVIAVLPLLPLLIVLLPLVALAGVPMLAIFRPALLRGLPRDVRFVIRLVSATRQLNQRLTKSRGTFTTADYWAETVCKHSAKTALVFGERTYTYAQVDAESDRVARWALDQRLAPGDAVALLCSNRPEHLFCWLVRLDTSGRSPDTSGRSLDTSGRSPDTSGRSLDIAGRSLHSLGAWGHSRFYWLVSIIRTAERACRAPRRALGRA